MTLSLVLNDLSLRHQVTDRHAARILMKELIETLKTAVEHKVTVLRMRDEIGNIVLSPNYPLNAWFGDREVPRDEILFLQDFMTRYPYIRPYDDDLQNNDEVQSDRALFEGKFSGEAAEGLSFAHLLDGLALSLLSDQCWDTPWLDLICMELDPESEVISEYRERLRHVSRARHVSKDHASWIEEQIQSEVRNGSDLIRNAATLFPNLVFCGLACKQIERMAASSMHLPRILKRLLELERLANSWTKDNFNYGLLHNASPESQLTMSRYGEQRSFVCPDGQRRTFDWHLKGLPRGWRIYVWADSLQKKILIGYVGKHLSTFTKPT